MPIETGQSGSEEDEKADHEATEECNELEGGELLEEVESEQPVDNSSGEEAVSEEQPAVPPDVSEYAGEEAQQLPAIKFEALEEIDCECPEAAILAELGPTAPPVHQNGIGTFVGALGIVGLAHDSLRRVKRRRRRKRARS